MSPLFKNGRFYCLHCEIPLKEQPEGAICGICQSFHSRSELAKSKMAGLSPEERSLEQLAHAKEILRAEENSIKDIAVIDIGAHSVPLWKIILSFIGVPVEERDYSTERIPFVSFLFIALCVVAFILGSNVTTELQLDPKNLGKWGGLNFFTYAFAHAGVLHLIGNLFFFGHLWTMLKNIWAI